MSAGEFGLVIGVGLVGLFATLILVAAVGASIFAKHDRERTERLQRAAREARRGRVECLPVTDRERREVLTQADAICREAANR
jgi:threonine dehydrogenase-like Zn-dependent dehydrogenase